MYVCISPLQILWEDTEQIEATMTSEPFNNCITLDYLFKLSNSVFLSVKSV
jgi:hypothetical protein